MRVFEKGSFPTPIRGLLDGLIVIVVFLAAAEALLVGVLLVEPGNPLRERFRVTTLAEVPTDVWPVDDVVQLDTHSSTATVEPWAFITFLPSNRAFVAVTAVAGFSWWVCLLTVLLQLRHVLSGVSATTPFPRDNIRRIRLIGWAILGLAATDLVIDAGMITYMQTTLTVAGRPPVIPTAIMLVDFPLGTILAGMAVLILAWIFRAGADLQDEQALTI